MGRARLLRSAGLWLLSQGEWNYDAKHARVLLWDAQDGRCGCCGRALVPHLRQPRSGDRDTIDHVWPLGVYGPDKLGNILLLTANCNHRKGSRPPPDHLLDTLERVNAALGWPTPRMLLWRAA